MRQLYLVLFVASTAATAEPWKCELNHPDVTVITKVPFDAPVSAQHSGAADNELRADFAAAVRAAYGVQFIHNYYDCGPAPEDWERYLSKRPKARLLSWKPVTFSTGSPTGLVTETVAPSSNEKPASLEGQRIAAAAAAKRVADAVRNEAATKDRIAKFMEELKKRGAAQ